uniref:Uncharacterized protein n=1 Tax=Fervidicoccus fontis TaxID=683846 RepID=A0A7J3ZIL3_9CREN
MEEDLVSRLEELLSLMNSWEKRPVLKSGKIVIELVKLPERKTKSRYEPERLALHVRREDAFRGVIIQSREEYEDLHAALNTDKIRELISAITEVSKRRRVQEFEL